MKKYLLGFVALLFIGGAGIQSSTTAVGTAGGDLSGTYPNPTLAKINGTTISGVTGTAGNPVVLNASPSIGSASLANSTMTGSTTLPGSGAITSIGQGMFGRNTAPGGNLTTFGVFSSGASGVSSVDTNFDQVIAESSGNGGFTAVVPTASFGGLTIANVSNNRAGAFIFTDATGWLLQYHSAALATWDDFGHYTGSQQSGPTIAANACGSTTQGSVTGNDSSFTLTVGTAGVTSCTVSFGHAWPTGTPKACVFSPTNTTAAATGTTAAYLSSLSTTQVVLTGAALASASYDLHCE